MIIRIARERRAVETDCKQQKTYYDLCCDFDVAASASAAVVVVVDLIFVLLGKRLLKTVSTRLDIIAFYTNFPHNKLCRFV